MSSSQALRPPASEVAQLPPLIEFKHTKTKTQVFTHRSFSARPNAVFEDPPDNIAPDNEVLEFVGDSVLSLAVASLIRITYPGLRVGPHAKIRSLVVQNATIAQISQHYRLADNLRANSSQLVSLRFSTYVQADLFEAYVGGLHVDWGYEHIRTWLYRVLTPYVKEAYSIVKGEYVDADSSKRRSLPYTVNKSPKEDLSNSPSRRHSQQPHGERNEITVHTAMVPPATPLYAPPTPLSQASNSPGRQRDPLQSIMEDPLDYSRNYIPSPLSRPDSGYPSPNLDVSGGGGGAAEGHLPLLNQVIQHAKRWIDWDWKPAPNSSPTTPIWDAVGTMSKVKIAEGRGNTKKLAKNDAARRLIGELQTRLGKKAVTTASLAKELERYHMEKQTIPLDTLKQDSDVLSRLEQLGLNDDMPPYTTPPYRPLYGAY